MTGHSCNPRLWTRADTVPLDGVGLHSPPAKSRGSLFGTRGPHNHPSYRAGRRHSLNTGGPNFIPHRFRNDSCLALLARGIHAPERRVGIKVGQLNKERVLRPSCHWIINKQPERTPEHSGSKPTPRPTSSSRLARQLANESRLSFIMDDHDRLFGRESCEPLQALQQILPSAGPGIRRPLPLCQRS